VLRLAQLASSSEPSTCTLDGGYTDPRSTRRPPR